MTEIPQTEKEKLVEYSKKFGVSETIWGFIELSQADFSEHVKQQKGHLTLKYNDCMATKTGRKVVFFIWFSLE